MRKISLFVAIAMLINIIQPVKAESYMEWAKRDPEGFYKKMMCMEEESIEKGYYSDARDMGSSGSSESSSTVASQGTYGGVNRGYVFGDDELHVVGTPSDSSGYTSAGDYTNMPSAGKGWVYDADELHVVGLPSDPETGYTLPGSYGNIGE